MALQPGPVDGSDPPYREIVGKFARSRRIAFEGQAEPMLAAVVRHELLPMSCFIEPRTSEQARRIHPASKKWWD